MDSKEGLRTLLEEFGIADGCDSALRLQQYLALLKKWNAHINLTANADWVGLAPLFREGIWAAGRYPVQAQTHLDVGSGAGFPAIVLRILNPGMRLEMVESRGKKGAFLETVAYELDLPGTNVHTQRLEVLLHGSPKEKMWDCISWKAIKLNSRDLLNLKAHAHHGTQFWMFHGKEVAVEDASHLEANFQRTTCRQLPGQRESFLSIYSSKM